MPCDSTRGIEHGQKVRERGKGVLASGVPGGDLMGTGHAASCAPEFTPVSPVAIAHAVFSHAEISYGQAR